MKDTKLKFKLYPREFLFSAFLMSLIFSLYSERHITVAFFTYFDEILCIVCILYILYFSFKRGIRDSDLTILSIMIVLSILTIIGNYLSKISTNVVSILIDLIALYKMFTVFVVYKFVGERDKKHQVIAYLVPICKIIIITGTFFGIVSMFFDVGMTEGVRYGIPQYSFIFINGTRYGYILACCLLVLLLDNVADKTRRIYTVMVAFNIIIITKGSIYIVLICYIVFSFMWRGGRAKLKASNIAIIAILGTFGSTYQINTYLKDKTSPRYLLLKYGFKTANTYFPFGSGFATYGSDQALTHYSSLYYQYGFNQIYGMTPDYGAFLNDCYMGMVFGEFGYFGAILFIILMFLVFVPIVQTQNLGKYTKALILSIYIGLIISSLGTAIIKSSIGVFTFAILGVASGYSHQKYILDRKQLSNE